jgi:hypothetical protein
VFVTVTYAGEQIDKSIVFVSTANGSTSRSAQYAGRISSVILQKDPTNKNIAYMSYLVGNSVIVANLSISPFSFAE